MTNSFLQVNCELVVDRLRQLESEARQCLALDDVPPPAGKFLEAYAACLLATVDGSTVDDAEGSLWLKAATAISSQGEAPRPLLLVAIAESPVATGDFGKLARVLLSPGTR